MSIVIAGERSGVGKTTITLALLAFLAKKGGRVQSYKVGPDYIDPMFHRYVTGRACRNLDPVLTSEAYVQQCFAQHGQSAEFALVEGVMGLFDGAAGRDDFASTAHIARLLDLPILLVLDCSRLSHSIAALTHGYCSFDPRLTIAGVVLNRVGSDRHLDLLTTALEPLGIPILGVVRRQDSITIPDRHLGLVPTGELDHLNPLIDQLAYLGETCFDWTKLLPLVERGSKGAGEWGSFGMGEFPREVSDPLRIAIAYDRAFNFYYQDNLDLLEALGSELVFWSPLQDALPDNVQGLYFGGGFPEVFAQTLADNQQAQHQVRQAIHAGMPAYAECGGLMYLSQTITDFAGQTCPMVGVLPTEAVMGSRLTLGYRTAIAQQDTPLISKGTTTWAHEFHRSYLRQSPDQPVFAIPNSPLSAPKLASPLYEGWCYHHLHASYLHLHWGSQPELPLRFLRHCQRMASQKSGFC